MHACIRKPQKGCIGLLFVIHDSKHNHIWVEVVENRQRGHA